MSIIWRGKKKNRLNEMIQRDRTYVHIIFFFSYDGHSWVRYCGLSLYKIINIFLVWQLSEHRIGGQTALEIELGNSLTSGSAVMPR